MAENQKLKAENEKLRKERKEFLESLSREKEANAKVAQDVSSLSSYARFALCDFCSLALNRSLRMISIVMKILDATGFTQSSVSLLFSDILTVTK